MRVRNCAQSAIKQQFRPYAVLVYRISSTTIMLRLSTFCLLLALAVAQNGYEYNKPGNPFGPTSTRPGAPTGPPGSYSPTSGYQPTSGFPSTTAYPRPQTDDYSGSTPGYSSGPSDFPSGPNQGYPGSSGQQPQSGFPGQGPSYPGQGPSGPSNYPGSGPSYRPDGQISGGPPGSGQNYQPGGFGPGVSGFGSDDTGAYEGGDYSAIPGTPDIDYPILSYIPQTSFRCDSQPYPGYYADVEARCQVFHVCANNRTYDFLCPNGTIFSQQDFVCVWWNQFDCNTAPSLYEINANIYDYSSTTGSQGDLTSFGDYNQGATGPGSFPGSRPQGPSDYPGTGPQGPSNYPGPQGPGYTGSSTPYPTSPSYSGSTGFPSTQGPYPGSGPSTPYPGSPGSQNSYPGSPGPSTSYPSTRPNSSYSSSGSYQGNQGYPSGKPNGPNFPTSGNGRPPTPNREYLPPKN